MRYKIENENAKAELEYNNRIYPIDDTLAGYKKFSDVMQKADAGPEDILTAGLGKEAAKEIMDTNPRYKDIQDICVLIGAAIKGVSPEEAYSMIGQSKKKK